MTTPDPTEPLRRVWRMPRIPLEVKAVTSRLGHRYNREGETRWWVSTPTGGVRMTERDLLAGYDPLTEVLDA